jgi:serine/threonine protein kinase
MDYIAREQAQRGSNVDHRADIYSPGCTLFTILAGQAPFAGNGHASIAQKVLAHIQEPLPPVSRIRSDIPTRIAEILQLMTAKQPAQRFQSAAAVAEALAPFGVGADLYRLVHEQHVAATLPLSVQGKNSKTVYEPSAAVSTSLKSRWKVLVSATVSLLVLLTVSFIVRPRWFGLPGRNHNEGLPEKSGRLVLWEAWRHEINELFQRPVMLEAAINMSPSNLSDPTMTYDRRTLAFCQNLSIGLGGFDLWIADRPGADVSGNAPVNAGPAVNSDHSEWEPELSADGLSLIFHSDRPNPNGGTDLWIARRVARNVPFDTATNLGTGVNSADNEGGAALSSDGRTLLFHRFSSTNPGMLTH